MTTFRSYYNPNKKQSSRLPESKKPQLVFRQIEITDQFDFELWLPFLFPRTFRWAGEQAGGRQAGGRTGKRAAGRRVEGGRAGGDGRPTLVSILETRGLGQ